MTIPDTWRAALRDHCLVGMVLGSGRQAPVSFLEFFIRLRVGEEVEPWRIIRELRYADLVRQHTTINTYEVPSHVDLNVPSVPALRTEDVTALIRARKEGVQVFDRSHLPPDFLGVSETSVSIRQRELAEAEVELQTLLDGLVPSLWDELFPELESSPRRRRRRKRKPRST